MVDICEINLILTWSEDCMISDRQHKQQKHKAIHRKLELLEMQHFLEQTENYMYQALLSQLKMITNYGSNKETGFKGPV